MNPIGGEQDMALETRELSVFYGASQAVKEISLTIPRNRVVAFIGPSGCGKSTFLRCFNRMNDLIPVARVEGEVLFQGSDLYSPDVDAVEVRRRIGMVFQKPNPFPKSIYDNVAFGLKINGFQGNMDEQVERSLRNGSPVGRGEGSAAGERIRPVRRAAAAFVHRPCPGRRARDPAHGRAGERARSDRDGQDRRPDRRDLKKDYTIVIVTHNMQQAARVSDYTAFLYIGELIEYGDTERLFTNPSEERTEQYITGRFG